MSVTPLFSKENMDIFVVGLNHKSAPVEIRERLAFSDQDLEKALPQLRKETGLSEGLILSTCNRVEVYGVSPSQGQSDAIKKFLCQNRDVPKKEMESYFYDQLQPGSIGHLFRVASGLDSMVLGETEIFGQVKKAYQKANDLKTVGAVLHRMFQKTFHIGKRVRSETGINTGAISVSSVAVELAEKIFGNLEDKTVMIMGAGEVSESTVHHLVERGTRSILASNRSFDRAQKIAERFLGEAVQYDDSFERMRDVDIVISSTSAPHPIIQEEKVRLLMQQRGQKPLFFIDIAVPRDVDPRVDKIDNVYLYNIDDLKGLAEGNLKQRQAQLSLCESLIDEEVSRFMGWVDRRWNSQ